MIPFERVAGAYVAVVVGWTPEQRAVRLFQTRKEALEWLGVETEKDILSHPTGKGVSMYDPVKLHRPYTRTKKGPVFEPWASDGWWEQWWRASRSNGVQELYVAAVKEYRKRLKTGSEASSSAG